MYKKWAQFGWMQTNYVSPISLHATDILLSSVAMQNQFDILLHTHIYIEDIHTFVIQYLNHCYLYHFHTRKWWVVTYFLKVCFILRTTLCLGTAVFHFTYVECKHSLQFYTHRMVAKVSQFCVLIFK